MTDFLTKKTESEHSFVNEPLVYGCEITDKWQNKKWGKITFKINGAGNLVIEVSPSLIPGSLPPGVSPGRVPKGTKLYNYNSKILYSMEFDECVSIIEFNKKRFDWDNNTGLPVKLTTITPIQFYRDTDLFKKTLSMSYNEVGDGNYLVNMNFNMTDCNGITTKIRIPSSLDNFDTLVKLFETYVDNFFIIKYFNKVELRKDEKINMLMEKINETNTMLKKVLEIKEGNN